MTAQDQVDDKQRQVFQRVVSVKPISKVIRVAEIEPEDPTSFPHVSKNGCTEVVYEPFKWWTSGFFPGSLRILTERVEKHKRDVGVEPAKLELLAKHWQKKLEPHQNNTGTHDIGFLIMPSFYRDYKLHNSKEAAEIIVTSANSLLTRWSDKVGAFRSWNGMLTHCMDFRNMETDFLVIIDNMMNLDLLYAATEITGDAKYADHATKHAETTLERGPIRKDYSTYHMVVYDPTTGARKVGLTVQGYEHESCWARGQAWAIYGFATCYKYTKNPKFLEAARKLSDCFLSRVEDGAVYWDFDAPRPCVWDTSAATVACSGMLLICQLENTTEYLPAVSRILERALDDAQSGADGVYILDHATVNNNRFAIRPSADTGLVYADYYFLEAGNRLIEMGLA
jgi:hypothetical protein